MALCKEDTMKYVKRLLLARMRILAVNGFYGLLLMHVTYSLDEETETAYTDGQRIAFSPKFMDDLSDSELDFVLMHEIMHVVLQHCLRGGDRDDTMFNIACDIVVNSNILLSNQNDLSTITLHKYGESMHIAPDGKEGHLYTAEQVYDMLQKKANKSARGKGADGGKSGNKDEKSSQENRKTGGNGKKNTNGGWDDHTRWGTLEEGDYLRDLWVKRFEDACEAISIREASTSCGTLPAFAKRLWGELRKPQTDWRTILHDFVQEDVNDYSFSPPDRRFGETPFFLPDYNEKEDRVEDILFMIDTSGSMTDKMITAAYSEVKGAIDQFDGKLKGWLGFFDAAIIEPKPFSNEEEFRVIKAAGGGGTSFHIIFEYVARYMHDKTPASIIILTDGYAPFPKEEDAMGIPVLWLLNNENINPDWGRVARIKIDE